MTLTDIITSLHFAGKVSDADLMQGILTSLHLFNSTRSLFAIEKVVKELCEYERSEP